jgi:parvulin-like peptidyl-prolyl isomerase
MRNKLFLFILGSLVLDLTAPPLQAKVVDQIAVIAGQESLTEGELEESIESYFQSQGQTPPSSKTPEYETARRAVLDSFIEEVALANEADNEKIEVPDAEVDHAVDQQIDTMKKGFATDAEFQKELDQEGITLDDLRGEIKTKIARQLKASHMLRQKQQDLPQSLEVTDQQAQDYYNQHLEDYDQAHFCIILFRVAAGSNLQTVKEAQTEAQQVLGQLKGGADFAAAATKYSEDQGSSDKGGDVGTVSKSELEPKLAKGVFSIPAGGLGLVHGEDGFYIVKVLSRGQADFPSVASEIKDQLKKTNQDAALKDWVETLKKKVYVEYGTGLASVSTSTNPLPYDSVGQVSTMNSFEATGNTVEANASSVSETLPDSTAATELGDVDASEKAPVYSNLPDEGSIALDVNLDPWFYGTSDLAQNYGPGVNVNQGFPLGWEGDLGLELAVDPQLQLGAILQVLSKFPPTVTDKTLTKGVWSESAVGIVAGPRFLLPLFNDMNLTLSAQGGYYFLFGSNVDFSGTNNGYAYLDGSNFGGQLGADLEFFMDDEKTWALDLGLGYRFLVFSPKVAGGISGYNLDGYQADMSGVKTSLGFRFYLDK